jgi:hypothetical protein
MPERTRHTRQRPRPAWLSAPVLGVAAVALAGGGLASLLVRPHSSAPAASSRPATSAPTSRFAAPLASSIPSLSSSATPSATSPPAPATGAAGLGGCPVAPADSIWRTRVDQLPVSSLSNTYIAAIGANAHAHADFGSGTWDGQYIGIPVTSIPPGTRGVPVSFDDAGESDPGPYPLPPGALIEGGAQADGDRHVIAVDPGTCRDYELYDATPNSAGASWHAGSGAVFNLNSDALRPAGWTSADAAGLPILPGLARYDEASTGTINHALRITVPRSQQAYIWPARHSAGAGNANLPPMGLRLRLKASVDISSFPPQARAVAQALKTYGAIVADNGSAWYISGTQDERWSNDQLSALSQLVGSDFEAVDVSSLRISADSGAAR